MRRLAIGACALVLGCAREAAPPARPNVLLITIDTLRADRLSCAGYGRPTTPHLDRLAAEGLRFTHVETPRAKTTPAIASLMTSLFPHEHGVRELLTPLAPRFPLLAEALRGAGYATHAIVGNYVLQDRFSGLARGFESWSEELPETHGVPPDDVPQRTARSMTDGALAALDLGRAADRPWFLWLHYMDPHGLYDPPTEHRIFHRVVADPIPDDPGKTAGDLHRFSVASYNVPPGCTTPDGHVDAALVRDLYDGEVHYVDAEIGRLLDALRAAGALEKTLVVVTADHGESLGEHRYWFEHGRDTYETTCRVPLIVRLPGPSAPAVHDEDLSLVDLAPKMLDWLHLPPLRPASNARAVFVEKIERADLAGAVQAKAVRIGDWKMIRQYTHDAKGLVLVSEELYDLARDPGETANRMADPPEQAPLARLRAELLGFAAADVRFPDLAKLLQAEREKLAREDPEALRILQKLGY